MSKPPHKEYIGDGVHIEDDDWHVILTIPAGSSMSGLEQCIALEPKVLARLYRYRSKMLERIGRENAKARKETP